MINNFFNKTMLCNLIIVTSVSFIFSGCTNNKEQNNKITNTISASITTSEVTTPSITPSPISGYSTVSITNGTKTSPQKTGNTSSNDDPVIANNENVLSLGPGFVYYKLHRSGKVEMKPDDIDPDHTYNYKIIENLGPVKKVYSGSINGQDLNVIFLMKDGFLEKLDIQKAMDGILKSDGRINAFENITDIQEVGEYQPTGQTVYAVKKDGSKVAISPDNVK